MIKPHITDRITEVVLFSSHDTDFFFTQSDGKQYILHQRKNSPKNNTNLLSLLSTSPGRKFPLAVILILNKDGS